MNKNKKAERSATKIFCSIAERIKGLNNNLPSRGND